MYCKNTSCGIEVPENMRICPRCGGRNFETQRVDIVSTMPLSTDTDNSLSTSGTKMCRLCQAFVAGSYLICPKCGGRDFSISDNENVNSTSPPITPLTTSRPRRILRPFMQVALMPRWAMIAVVAGVLLFFLSLVVGSNKLADTFALWSAPDTDERLVQATTAELLDEVLPAEDPGAAMVQRIGKDLLAALPEPVGFNYRFFVLPEDDFNAFAMPGGIIVIFSGLLDRIETPEQLAAVIAHEIEHVENRHSLRKKYRQLATLSLIGIFFGVSQDPSTITTAELITLKYSRDMERQADREGARLLARAGVSPQVMVEMLNLIGNEEGGWSPSIIRTHPSPESRSRIVSEMPETRLNLPLEKPEWSPSNLLIN